MTIPPERQRAAIRRPLGGQAVEAIGHDGSIYVARRGPAFRADAYASAAARFTAAARGLPLSHDLRATLAAHFAHLVSLVLHQAGAIHYESTLAGERAHAFRRHALLLGQTVNVASHDWQKHLAKQRQADIQGRRNGAGITWSTRPN